MKPIRMCISCKGRFEQNILIRLQCKEKELLLYNKNGRSFYLCKLCLNDEKKLHKILCRQCKNNKKYHMDLKEILVDVR